MAFRGDFSRLWAVIGQVPGETTLTLDIAGEPLEASVGDLYRGVLRFDHVAIRGRSNVVAGDVVFTTEPVEVESTSTWTAGNEAPPTVDPGRIALSTGIFGADVTGGIGAIVDVHPPVVVTLTNLTTSQTFTTTVAVDGAFSLPVAGSDGELLQLVATDSGEPPLASAPLQLGPFTGGTGVVTTLPDEPRFFDGEVAISFRCAYEPRGSETSEHGELLVATYDASNPAQPTELFRSFVENWPGSAEFEGCSLANETGHQACEIESGFSGCFTSCSASCAPEDWSCFDACFATCDSPEYQLCSDAVWRYGEACATAASCDDGLAECVAYCSGGGGAPSCSATCAAADAACRTAVPPDLGLGPLRARCGNADYESGVLAFAQGPYLRVVDLRDPTAPVFAEPEQTLQMLEEDAQIQGVDIEGGTVHLIERDSPHRYRRVDVRDPRHPRDLGVTASLGGDASNWIHDSEVQEGELSVLSGAPYSNPTTAAFGRHDVAGPGQPIYLDSKFVQDIVVDEESLLLLDDLAIFPKTYFEGFPTRHREESSTDPLAVSDLPYPPIGAVELGDRFVVDYGGLVSIGTLSTSRYGHGYVEETTRETPDESWGELRVGAGRFWIGSQGFLS
ncbi:MAG: hypothetical protein K8H90_06065, partial [Thermoanaerobaculia bacterium]|nr:hypothetical protein [Thermoanaerobaculia bacterium]